MKEMRQQQPGRLVPADDGAGDCGTQKRQTEGQACVTPINTEAPGERLNRGDLAIFKQLPETMGTGKGLDQRQVEMCG
jgi:hypothetical protein